MNPRDRETDFRFGVYLLTAGSRQQFIKKCQRAEAIGYDVIGVVDHIPLMAPFPSLMLAAEVTERPRIATTVLNAALYNPTLLARDAAATDQLTNGRLELGIGAGYASIDFWSSGRVTPSPNARVSHLGRTVRELKRFFADSTVETRPVQQPWPPICIAGHGQKVLTIAAHEADIVGFSGIVPRSDSDTPDLASYQEVSKQIKYVTTLPWKPMAEFNINVRRLAITNDRKSELERLGSGQDLSSDELLQLPSLLVGTPKQIVEQLVMHRENFGLTYFSVSEPDMDALAPVVELLH